LTHAATNKQINQKCSVEIISRIRRKYPGVIASIRYSISFHNIFSDSRDLVLNGKLTDRRIHIRYIENFRENNVDSSFCLVDIDTRPTHQDSVEDIRALNHC